MTAIQRACDVENISDFSRYYQNSWVGWHPTDSEHIAPTFVGGMPTHATVFLRFLVKDEDTYRTEPHFQASWKDIIGHIDFGQPDVGMFPEGPSLVYRGYFSPRAPKKGFRPRDLSLHYFNNWAIRKKYVQGSQSEAYSQIWHAFNPQYKSLEAALKSLNEGESVGVPINRIMGVFTVPKYRVPIFAYKRWQVGHVESPELIHLKTPFADYAEEIERQTGAKVVIE